MDWLLDNWPAILGLIAVIGSATILIVDFIRTPRASQIAKVKEWLIYAVIKAEKDLGSGTGEIKLRYVYNMFLKVFPQVAKILSFEDFSKLVDEALKNMEKLLESNEDIKKIIKN